MRKQKIDMMSILQENEAIIEGHFELPNSLHIQNYIDTDVLFQYPGLTTKIAQGLADLFDKKIDVVLAPTAHNAIIAQEVARIKGARALTAICVNGKMRLKGHVKIEPGQKVLIVDNVSMTGRTSRQAAALVAMHQADTIGIAVIVDRSDSGAVDNIPLRSLLNYPLQTYYAGDCPMCKEGLTLKKTGEDL